MSRVVAVIPARMASSRYPGKPLVSIANLPMIEHVRRRAMLAQGIDHVVVATCDAEIMQAVQRSGGEAVMTSNAHTRCTDRVAEAMLRLEGDVVVIVQGDEPLLRPDSLDQVIRPLLERGGPECSNLLSPLESNEDLGNPNIVKALCDRSGRILFLTRANVPFFRERVACPVYRQTGIIAFRTAFLRVYSQLEETPFERAESVDMLRVLEHGYAIAGVIADYSTVGVDRPSDVPLVEKILRQDALQKSLLDRISAANPVMTK